MGSKNRILRGGISFLMLVHPKKANKYSAIIVRPNKDRVTHPLNKI